LAPDTEERGKRFLVSLYVKRRKEKGREGPSCSMYMHRRNKKRTDDFVIGKHPREKKREKGITSYRAVAGRRGKIEIALRLEALLLEGERTSGIRAESCFCHQGGVKEKDAAQHSVGRLQGGKGRKAGHYFEGGKNVPRDSS